MKVTEDALLESGFNASELQRIKENIEVYGGDLEEAIQYFASFFRAVLWVFYGGIVLFILVCISNDLRYIICTAISMLITLLITVCVQPPDLTYKSWRYWRINKTNPDS